MRANKLQAKSDIKEKVVFVNKTSKVVKGGRKFSFCALVLAGKPGEIGLGFGKAEEVASAKDKAARAARENLMKIPRRDSRTIHHLVKAKYGSGKIILRPAPPGTGIIAGGPIRAVMELAGFKDVVAKSLGSSNPHNMIKAALRGLRTSASPRVIAEKRRMKVGDIVGQREATVSSTKRKVEKRKEEKEVEKNG